MKDAETIWLVRTRAGDILGPFTQRALVAQLKDGAFCAEDEIAAGGQDWISAQGLASRELDDFTQTQTRTAITKSTQAGEPPTDVSITHPTQTDTDVLPEQSEEASDGTPLPTPEPIHNVAKSDGIRPVFLIFTVAFFAGWMVLLLVRKTEPPSPGESLSNSMTVSSPITDTESPYLKKIYQWIQSGKREEALNDLRRRHQKLRNSAEQEYKIPYAALLITEEESIRRARGLLKEVLASRANARTKALAHRWMGYLQLSEDRNDRGANHFLDALEINPRDAAARFNLGRAYLKQRKYKKALDYFRLAETEMNSTHLWLAEIYKGRTKAALGKMDEARVAFRTAMEMAQDRWLTYIYYSLFLKAIQAPAEAKKVIRRMISRDPHYEVNTPAPFGYYQEKVNYREYLDSYNEVMVGAPRTETDLGRFYLSYLLSGPNSAEGARIRRHAQKKGSLSWKIISLKVLLDGNAKPDAIRKALKTLPPNLTAFGYYAYVLRGEAYVRLNRIKEAQQDFQHALVLEPKTAVSRLAYAVLLKKTSRNRDAKSEINNLLSYHPNYIPAILSERNF